MAGLVVHVFLVQRPADALHGAALYLAFDKAGVNGGADILKRRVAQNLDLARVRIDLYIHDVHGEGRTGAAWFDRGAGHDRRARLVAAKRPSL